MEDKMESRKSLDEAKAHILDNFRKIEELARDSQWHIMAECLEMDNYEAYYHALIDIWREARNLQRQLGAAVD